MDIGETLISLLLKLHSKLSGQDGCSYIPDFEPDPVDSRIGDGVFFLSKVLNKLGRMSCHVKSSILETRQRLYPELVSAFPQSPSHRSDDAQLPTEGESSGLSSPGKPSVTSPTVSSLEDRKAKAAESRRRAMAFFKTKRAIFLKREKVKKFTKEAAESSSFSDTCDDGNKKWTGEGEASASGTSQPTTSPVGRGAYECVICYAKNVPSTNNALIGYVGLLTVSYYLTLVSNNNAPKF